MSDDFNYFSRATRGHDDSSFAFRTTCGTDDLGFNLRAPRDPDDSSRHLLDGARLASGHPTGASRAASWCGPRFSHGSSASNVDLRGYRFSATQALHRCHSLSGPEVSSGRPCRSSLADGYGARVHLSHVQRYLGLGFAPSRSQCCH
jgi:hypothetical protein